MLSSRQPGPDSLNRAMPPTLLCNPPGVTASSSPRFARPPIYHFRPQERWRKAQYHNNELIKSQDVKHEFIGNANNVLWCVNGDFLFTFDGCRFDCKVLAKERWLGLGTHKNLTVSANPTVDKATITELDDANYCIYIYL